MASMTEIICKCGCKRKKMVRTADVRRGWGKYFSKSCKAKVQSKKIRYRPMRYSKDGVDWPTYDGSDEEHEDILDGCELGWDEHKLAT